MTVQLAPCRHVHLYIDNKNAIAWSAGRCRSNNQFSLHLISLNCYLQALYPHTLQTRSYINTKVNVSADSISRLRFDHPSLEGLPRFQLEANLIRFLLGLSTSFRRVQFPTLLRQHTEALTNCFSAF